MEIHSLSVTRLTKIYCYNPILCYTITHQPRRNYAQTFVHIMEIGPVPVMYKFKMTTTVDRVEKSSFNQYMDAAMVISLTLHKVLIHTAAEAGYIE